MLLMNNNQFRDLQYFDVGGGPETGIPIGVALCRNHIETLIFCINTFPYLDATA